MSRHERGAPPALPDAAKHVSSLERIIDQRYDLISRIGTGAISVQTGDVARIVDTRLDVARHIGNVLEPRLAQAKKNLEDAQAHVPERYELKPISLIRGDAFITIEGDWAEYPLFRSEEGHFVKPSQIENPQALEGIFEHWQHRDLAKPRSVWHLPYGAKMIFEGVDPSGEKEYIQIDSIKDRINGVKGPERRLQMIRVATGPQLYDKTTAHGIITSRVDKNTATFIEEHTDDSTERTYGDRTILSDVITEYDDPSEFPEVFKRVLVSNP